MKPTLLFATLSMALASPSVFAKSELEILRSRCSEQERQIHMLEDENADLRNAPREKRAPAAKTETVSAAVGTTTATPVSNPRAAVASTYTVKAGDSFAKIARRVGTSPEKLAKANGLKTSSVIRPGQKLKVTGAASAVAQSAPAQTAEASQPSKQTAGTHKVRAGDTYSSISKKHGVSTASLIAANPKVKPSALRPGQLVNLGASSSTMTVSAPAAHSKAVAEKTVSSAVKAPAVRQNVPVSTASSTPVSAPAPTTAPAHSHSAPATPAAVSHTQTASSAPAPTPSHTPEKKIRPVTIEGEMTYGEFATQHGTDSDRLNALNGLDLNNATVLAKGSELYVPAQP